MKSSDQGVWHFYAFDFQFGLRELYSSFYQISVFPPFINGTMVMYWIVQIGENYTGNYGFIKPPYTNLEEVPFEIFSNQYFDWNGHYGVLTKRITGEYYEFK